MFPEEHPLERNNSYDSLFSEASSAVTARTSDQTVRGNNLSSKLQLRGVLLLPEEDSEEDLLQASFVEQPAVNTNTIIEKEQPKNNTMDSVGPELARQKAQGTLLHGFADGRSYEQWAGGVATEPATQYLPKNNSNFDIARRDPVLSKTASSSHSKISENASVFSASVFSGPLGGQSLVSGVGDESEPTGEQEEVDEEEKTKMKLPRRGRTDRTSDSSSPKTSSSSRAKYKDADIKRVESNRRRSRSRDATSRRERSRSRSHDPVSRGADRRSNQSPEKAHGHSTTIEPAPPRRRTSRRSHSQDRVLKAAQERLKESKKIRSKSQDPVGHSGKSDDVKHHRASTRQGRRPQNRTSTSKQTSGMETPSSSHTTSSHPKRASRSASQPRLSRRSQSYPTPISVAQPIDASPGDPILAEYLGEGSRAFDSILGPGETPATRTSVSHQSSGQHSNEDECISSERPHTPPHPLPPPPPILPEAEVRSPLMRVFKDRKAFLTPQPPANKVLYASKDPHFSPPIFHVNSMAKKVAGDRWLQDESIKKFGAGGRHNDSNEGTALENKSLDTRLISLGDENPDVVRSLVSDDHSNHSQDKSPMAPIRKEVKRAGQKPKTNIKPTLDKSIPVTPATTTKQGHSWVNGEKKNSPKMQLRRIADKVVSTSSHILKSSGVILDDSRSPTKKSPKSPSKKLSLGGMMQSSFGRLEDEEDYLASDDSFCILEGSFNDPREDIQPNLVQQRSSSWVIRDDGTRAPSEVKRKNALQNARRKVGTLLKSGGKRDSTKNHDGWGALSDSNSSIEVGEGEDKTRKNPNAAAKEDVEPLRVNYGEEKVSLETPVTVSGEPLTTRSPSPPQKDNSQAAAAEGAKAIPADCEAQPILTRKSRTGRKRSSSPTKTRNRSASPPKSSLRSSKHSSMSRSLHSDKSPFKNGKIPGDARTRVRKSGSTRAALDTALERHRRARSRSLSRLDETVTSNRRRLAGKDDGEFELNELSSTNRVKSLRTSSKQASRSSSPHSLGSAIPMASAASSRDRTTKQRPSSTSPGVYRSAVSKRREAMQKIRSLRTIGLLEQDDLTSLNHSSRSGAS